MNCPLPLDLPLLVTVALRGGDVMLSRQFHATFSVQLNALSENNICSENMKTNGYTDKTMVKQIMKLYRLLGLHVVVSIVLMQLDVLACLQECKSLRSAQHTIILTDLVWQQYFFMNSGTVIIKIIRKK